MHERRGFLSPEACTSRILARGHLCFPLSLEMRSLELGGTGIGTACSLWTFVGWEHMPGAVVRLGCFGPLCNFHSNKWQQLGWRKLKVTLS